MKACRRCKETKCLDEFGNNRGESDGKWRYCKKCTVVMNRETRERIKKAEKPKLEEYKCSCCQETKKISEFQKDCSRLSGVHPYCRMCHKQKEHTPAVLARAANQMREYRKRIFQEPLSVTWWRLRSNFMRQEQAVVMKKRFEESSCCFYCGFDLSKNIELVTLDHKTPKVRGGSNEVENLAISCRDCNLLKLHRTELEFKIFLKTYIWRFMELEENQLLHDYADRATGT